MYNEGVGLGESPDLVAPLLDAEPGGGNLLLRARDIREQAESLQKLDVLAAVERLCPRVALIAAVVLPEGREGLELREDVGPELRHPALRARHVGKRGCRELIVVAI